jgi:uncharacterized protein
MSEPCGTRNARLADMSGEHHDVALEFPAYLGRIEHLKTSNSTFARLFDQYRDVSAELHRIEAKLEMPTHAYVEALQRRRLHLKEEINRLLTAT